MGPFFEGFFFGWGLVMGAAAAVAIIVLAATSYYKRKTDHIKRARYHVFTPCKHGVDPATCIKCKLGVG